MTKFVLSGYIGFDNFGDEAIAGVVIEHLKKQGGEITVLSSSPQKTSKLYKVLSVHYLKFLTPIFKSDVLISGGGSLLQDVTSLKSLIYYLVVISTALLFRKKVVIFAQGFTPFRTFLGKVLTAFVLRRCDTIYVRDVKSQEILDKIKINSQLVADPVFGMEFESFKPKSGIGVQLRGFVGMSESFLQRLADEIALSFKGQEIKLLSLQDSHDLLILKKFSTLLSQKGLNSRIISGLSVKDCIEELSSLEYLIGMRFHAALVAAKAGVKVLGINYDVKVLNLSNHIGFPIIGLEQENFKEEFEQLKNLDSSSYNIPIFDFPKI